ncbi:tyrosine-type recombinase/integrase [Pseudovibrio sp. Tun.PSC04-5.I4]|uniref:tyrosine-type recombinase/integrase n=1 Tax=Pseudovibrio sp. Tun.PSC04-5.I4 TaxID=1798213 RepID=UPI00088ACDE4|nr:tyrosine-type recombinase/integrase [Pseudovibrio sp. Tun.PSC04-5.I4]SDQ27780.1 Site-specific recombinase XerD [Pseudovibrio sp. Tun.PSC04-5.I4]
MPKPKQEHLKYLYRDVTRHGQERWYYRKSGKAKIRLNAPYGTEEFYKELALARFDLSNTGTTEPKRTKKKLPLDGTFKWLADQYLTRAMKNLAPATQIQKRRVLHAVCEETCLSQSGQRLGDMSFKGLQKQHIAILRDQKGETPEAANHRLRSISTMFNWAVEVGLAGNNPAEHVKKIKNYSEGHHALTQQEIAQFLERHPKGTKAHLAMQIFRYTGLRISDTARLGRQHLYTINTEDGPQLRFKIAPQKSSKLQRMPVAIDLPVLPPLAEALEGIDHSHLTFLITEWNRPYSVKGLGNRMRNWFDMAGLPHCSAHGIRKAGAVLAAENGATSNQLLSMFGWTKLEQAELYTRMAQRKVLGDKGVHFLSGEKKKSGST